MKCLKGQTRIVIISLHSLIAVVVHRWQNLNSEVMSKKNKQKSGKREQTHRKHRTKLPPDCVNICGNQPALRHRQSAIDLQTVKKKRSVVIKRDMQNIENDSLITKPNDAES